MSERKGDIIWIPISNFVPGGINPDDNKNKTKGGINPHVANNGSRDQSLTGIRGPRVYMDWSGGRGGGAITLVLTKAFQAMQGPATPQCH